MTPPKLSRLRAFVSSFGALLSRTADEPEILSEGGRLLGDLVSQDDWLPDAFAAPNPDRYTQYLLHCDSRERFSVVAFVWGPGQSTPVHNHTVWGLVGVLRGGEISQRFAPGGRETLGGPALLHPGDVEPVSPRVGDVHKVSNAFPDRTSISIHVYGGDIGRIRRSVFTETGEKVFVSGYANDLLPNFWGASGESA
jgi:predicted metal-dependent enzyme (double-stranded beta helix superfamily)